MKKKCYTYYMRINSAVIHAKKQKHAYGALNEPVFRSSTFVFDNVEQGGARYAGQEEGYVYTRNGNPTTRYLEERLAYLEKAEDCLCTSSGIGAITSTIWTFLKKGDHILADTDLYGSTFLLFTKMLHKFGVEVTLIDFNDLELIKKSLKSNTVMVYFETPCNPTIKVNDIKAIATIAHNYNKHIKVVLDGTFASPYLQHPLQLGVDIVIHSMTKYINGHSDVLGGCVCGSKKDLKMIRDEGLRDSTGAVLSPDDAYLVLRGLKTLGVRMKTICENALSIAKYLEKSPYVKKVYYPGLKSHKNHTIAKKQMESFGGMISFETNLNFNQTKKFVNNLQMVTLAVSLGGVESLIEHPTSMTHVLFTKEALVKSGITPNLIRFSTGIEDVKDLINDFEQAFKNSKK